MSEQPGVSVETLRDLLRDIYRVEFQAAAIMVMEAPGSTLDVAEKVQRVSGRLADDVRGELRAMERWDVLLKEKS